MGVLIYVPFESEVLGFFETAITKEEFSRVVITCCDIKTLVKRVVSRSWNLISKDFHISCFDFDCEPLPKRFVCLDSRACRSSYRGAPVYKVLEQPFDLYQHDMKL